jgi:hypothetical protein
MKLTALVTLMMLGLSIPAAGQNKTSCKAFFQVVRADAQTPENFRTGMDKAQKKWWENGGQKKYPGLCLDGSVTTADKPRYLVIWSKPGSIERAAVAPGEVYGQTASAIQATAPQESIYRPNWNTASISIVSVSYQGNLVLPPVHMIAGGRAGEWFPRGSPRVLKVALQYLSTYEDLDSKQPVAAVPPPPTPSTAPAVRPTVTLQLSPTAIELGQSATLSWSSTDATTLSLAPAIGTVAPAGMISVSPADSTNYTITATGPGGEATDTVRITVSFFSLKTD